MKPRETQQSPWQTMDSRLTASKALDWRVHWIYCDLTLDIDRSSESAIKERLTKAIGGISRLKWELSTMLDTYESAVWPMIQSLPSYEKLEQSVNVLTTRLNDLARQRIDAEAAQHSAWVERTRNTFRKA